MDERRTRCKYCDNESDGKYNGICPNCRIKRPLVQQMRGMVQNAKDKVEREQRIKEDLKRVRENDR